MRNTQNLIAILIIVFGYVLLNILIELLMPIAWISLILLPLVFGYFIRELFRAARKDD
jgi:ABC-type amino acid transport system permease subunit